MKNNSLENLIQSARWIGFILLALEFFPYFVFNYLVFNKIERIVYFLALGLSTFAALSSLFYGLDTKNAKLFMLLYCIDFVAFTAFSCLVLVFSPHFFDKNIALIFQNYFSFYVGLFFIFSSYSVHYGWRKSYLFHDLMRRFVNDDELKRPSSERKKSSAFVIAAGFLVMGIMSLKFGRAQGALFVVFLASLFLAPHLLCLTVANIFNLVRRR